MERKIGEIFEYNGEWYQCVEGNCAYCSIKDEACEQRIINDVCKLNRIFKKLEKVGEPFTSVGKLYQHYKVFDIDNAYGDVFLCVHNYKAKTLTIEIKQNKEDMEENKTTFPKEANPLTRTVDAYVNGKISDKELIRSIKEMSDEYPYNKNNLKPFSLELAKQGKPVCTRDGRKARIICFDAKGEKPIIALIANGNSEDVNYYYITGKVRFLDKEDENDLMMLPEKKEGWINIYRNEKGEYWSGQMLFSTKKDATDAHDHAQYVTTVKVEWEE